MQIAESSTSPVGAAPIRSSAASSRPVAIWVYIGVFMLLIQVILGGITRLTGSGLSITEWNIVTGALPPTGQSQWQEEFDKYRQTEQFRVLNSDFTLSDFKFIFFWEWFHRFWARLVGLVFVVGFVGLLWKRRLQSHMIRPLLILFLLGALQGAVGWIMVVSGFTGDAIYVKPTRLALHFIFALGLIVYAFWFALQLSVPRADQLLQSLDTGRPMAETYTQRTLVRQVARLRHWTILILCLLLVQLLFGALMAGNKAANIAPTWPSINGDAWPPALFTQHPLSHDLVGNRITVQFIHRGLAYILLALVIIWSVLAWLIPATPARFRSLRALPLLMIIVQILLGIFSLLTSPGIIPNRWVAFDWLAQFHQVTGLLLLLTMVGMLYLVIPVKLRHAVSV
ncbi:MAG TPA: COX15/CtaA family protein [Puia sp.]|jgi:cytochrome c oxidase assembly protein subunit 15|nr:COX15/CtaA family protein [Puia sp.]